MLAGLGEYAPRLQRDPWRCTAMQHGVAHSIGSRTLALLGCGADTAGVRQCSWALSCAEGSPLDCARDAATAASSVVVRTTVVLQMEQQRDLTCGMDAHVGTLNMPVQQASFGAAL